jgi:hypothetical protein
MVPDLNLAKHCRKELKILIYFSVYHLFSYEDRAYLSQCYHKTSPYQHKSVTVCVYRLSIRPLLATVVYSLTNR